MDIYNEITKDIYDNKDDIALVVIDVQSEFCDPDYDVRWPLGNNDTVAVSEKIKSLVPEFRKAAIPVYALYYDHSATADPGFYKYAPAENDIVIRKTRDSAFRCTVARFNDTLKQEGISKLLVCGFNLSACVKETIMDANQLGFTTYLLEDLTEDGGSIKHPETQQKNKFYIERSGSALISAKKLVETINKPLFSL